MAIILLSSCTGSPGVTTTALGLALNWPRDVLLVDADRDPAQALEAGFLGGSPQADTGLMALAQLHRERRPIGGELLSCSVPLARPEDDVDETTGASKRFLPGFTNPRSALLFAPAWQPVADGLTALDAAGTDVIVDCGRLGPDGPVAPLMDAADVLLICIRSTLRSLAAARLHIPPLLEHSIVEQHQTQLGLAVIDAGNPYGSAEISKHFKLPVLVEVARDNRSARVLSDGEPPGRRFANDPLMRHCRTAAESLREQLNRRSEAISGSGSADDLILVGVAG